MPTSSGSAEEKEREASASLSDRVRRWYEGGARQHWVDYAYMAAFVILVLITALAAERFFTPLNISNLSRQIVTNGLISLGMLVVILTGGIDLSVGSTVALSGILFAGLTDEIGLVPAMLVGLVAAALVGVVNGLVIARFKLQPFIVTLATMVAVRGLVYVYSQIPQVPENSDAFRAFLGAAFLGPVPVPAIIMLLCFPLVWLFLNRTTGGRAIVAIGGNEEAVRLAGIGVGRHILLAYAISGFFAGLAGVILASRLGIAQPSVGEGYELDAIAACVIGGTSMSGGVGGPVSTFGGVLTLGLMNNLLNLFGVQPFYQRILKGLIIIISVLARRRER